MSTEREVVENEILSEHASVFSREAYVIALQRLVRDELIAECLKQYDMSGEMLDKYRRWQQTAVDRQNRLRDEQNDTRRWRSLALEAQSAMHEAVERFGAIQHIEQESAEYTHNAKTIARRLVHGIAQNAVSKLKVVLERIFEAQRQSPEEFFDLPF
jgi:response regulator of citrate/malate metabolism